MPAKAQIGVVALSGCRCRCGHEWLPREKSERPRVCPDCKSPNWDRPKKFSRISKTKIHHDATAVRGR